MRLSPTHRCLLIFKTLSRLYSPVPIATLHLTLTLATLSLLPPPPQIPFVLIPLTWAASLTTTVIVHSIANREFARILIKS